MAVEQLALGDSLAHPTGPAGGEGGVVKRVQLRQAEAGAAAVDPRRRGIRAELLAGGGTGTHGGLGGGVCDVTEHHRPADAVVAVGGSRAGGGRA